MAGVTLYRLRPRGPMRFGQRGIQVAAATELPGAATVFGGWCWSLHDLRGRAALEAALAPFVAGTPSFLLAAPLPWIGRVLLLPRPIVPPPAEPPGTDAPPDKRGKRYRWVEEGLWFRLAAGELPRAAFEDDAAFHQGQALWAAGEPGRELRKRLAALAARAAPGQAPAFWRVEQPAHVTIDRRADFVGDVDYRGQATPFYRGATWFAPGVDLALPVRWRDEGVRADFERALVLLGDGGLGGERTAGYGQFDVVAAEERDWPDADAGDAFVTLADYGPTGAEVAAGIFGEPAHYALAYSRGWVGRGREHYGVRLVTAGSTLRRLPGRRDYGQLVPLRAAGGAEHAVYRWGYAFPLPVATMSGG